MRITQWKGRKFDSHAKYLQVVVGRLDPFENGSCETKDYLQDDNIFGGFNVSYSDMVRYMKCKCFLQG